MWLEVLCVCSLASLLLFVSFSLFSLSVCVWVVVEHLHMYIIRDPQREFIKVRFNTLFIEHSCKVQFLIKRVFDLRTFAYKPCLSFRFLFIYSRFIHQLLKEITFLLCLSWQILTIFALFVGVNKIAKTNSSTSFSFFFY